MDKREESSLRSLPEPIQGSVFLLICRLLVVMVGIDVLYILVRIFVFDLHEKSISLQNVDIGFLLLLISSYVLQIFLLFTVLFTWLNKRYYIHNSHLIVKEGLFTKRMRVYDLKGIKSIQMSQGFIGKLCNFGTVSLVITAPNIKEVVSLVEIPNPQDIEKDIDRFL